MLTIVITLITIFCLILSIIKFPIIKIKNISISSFWVVVTIGALLLIFFQEIKITEIVTLMSKEIVNPIEILILFISITLISLVLDEVGFFILLANIASKKAKGSQMKLFVILYFLVSALTIFTSNDIIILTFTPFICALSRRAKINPIPYLVAEFVAANTWSLMLIIGNPTNIFLGLTFNITFFEYFKVMFVPTIAAGLVSFLIIYLIFRKSLKEEMTIDDIEDVSINKLIMIVSLLHLIVCTILLMISSFINLEMWLICLICAFSISMFLLFFNHKILFKSLKRSPWNLVPFIMAMFVIVLTLDKHNITKVLGDSLINITKNSKFKTIFAYGFSSIITDNLINNIPMSLAAIKILADSEIAAVYAVIIGSNIGAYLTPIGALAGIMWMSILKKEGIDFSFKKFTIYGLCIVPFVAITAFIFLFLII